MLPSKKVFCGQSTHSTWSFWSKICSLVPCCITASGPISQVRSDGTPRFSLRHCHCVTQLATRLRFLVTKAGIYYLIRLVLLKLPDQRE